MLIITLLAISTNSLSIEGTYSSYGFQVLMNDNRGYMCLKDGNVYAINISDELSDKIILAGTYKKNKIEESYRLDIDEEGYYNLIAKPGFIKLKLSTLQPVDPFFFDPSKDGWIVLNPFTRYRINKLLNTIKKD